MKRLIGALALAAVAMPLAGEAVAQAATRTVTLNATVGKFCRIANVLAAANINQALTVDANTGLVDTTPIPVNIGRIRCNTAASIQLSSANGALLTTGAPTADAGFANYINYTAAIATPVVATVAANLTTGVTTATAGTSVNTTGAHTNENVTLTITPTGPAIPLMYDGGTDYTDVVTITITPL